MRIAVLIIALFLTAIIGFQSLTIFAGAHVIHDQSLIEGGAVGALVAFLFVLGAAFALGVPKASVGCFAAAGALGLLVGSQTRFSDMTIWGVIALGLAVMSWFGARELARRNHPSPAVVSYAPRPEPSPTARHQPQAAPYTLEATRPASDAGDTAVAFTSPAGPAQAMAYPRPSMPGYFTAMRKFATGNGRAPRSEFWLFHLGFVVALVVAIILDGVLFGVPLEQTGWIYRIVAIVHLVAQASVMVRRLHDIDYSGFWALLAFTGVGVIPLAVLAMLPGTQEPNRFGKPQCG